MIFISKFYERKASKLRHISFIMAIYQRFLDIKNRMSSEVEAVLYQIIRQQARLVRPKDYSGARSKGFRQQS